jgi:DNA-binding GntR family transcriptional regulator
MANERVRVVSRHGLDVSNVERRLRDAILDGAIPAGASMTQAALGDQVEAGRTPLREALRLLQRDGLVVSAPNRRVQIAGLTSEDAEELYVMRVALETTAVRLTVPAMDSATIAELEGLMAKMEHYVRTEDRVGLREPHRAFHLLLTAGAGARCTSEISTLFDHAERYRLAHGARGTADWSLRSAEHRAILDAAAAGDADGTARELASHYGHTASLVFADLDPEYDPWRLRATLAATAPGSETAVA